MDRRFLNFVILLVIVPTAGCRNVSRDDVIGTWVLDPSSRAVLSSDLRNANGRFAFNRDGTFICFDVPALFYFPDQIPARVESGRGRWQLIREEGNQEVRLDFQAIDDWKGGLPYGTQLFVSRNRLRFFLGDPDEGRAVEFYKQ